MDLQEARGTLIEEARELLDAMENALLQVEAGGDINDAVNAAFRAAHTIKGSAGLFGLDSIVAFTHTSESVLDRVRAGELLIDDRLVTLLLDCRDYIGQLIDAVENGSEDTDPDPTERASLLDQLNDYLGHPHASMGVAASVQADPLERDGDALNVGNHYWHLSLRFGSDVLRNGMDPLSFLRYLGRMGEIVYIYTLTDSLPAASEMDAELCYLGFEIEFASDADKATIEGVFDFVRDESTIRILPPRSRVQDYIELIRNLPESPRRLGEILLACGSITQAELTEILALQANEGAGQPLGTLLVEQHVVHAPVVAAALATQKQAQEKKGAEQKFIKVEAGKLDQLITLVGELVIAGAATRLLASRSADLAMLETTAHLGTLVESIRDSALDLRMVQIKEIFDRFPRVVRDVSKELGKKIELHVHGGDAELDKSMVDKLTDPLMHVVRNAIDHGIEMPDEREQTDKPAHGSIWLNAYHESGSIVVEVRDDGRGLNRERIRAKAVERGLIHADAQLSDEEIWQLIFEPGFSTAEKVTNLSGRGVGMDVVKRNIQELRGEVELTSRPGNGTTLRIRLPLTLAIIDGFQVMVGESVFVIPLELVVECADLGSHDILHDIVNLRGQPLSFIRLRQLFEMPAPPEGTRESLVVVQYGQARAGLVVDKLLGEVQAVIKPLGQLFRHARVIAGSTILGDGRVALILDVAQLIHHTTHDRTTTLPNPGR
ncbi:chemotaxis protein CheA [Silvimonas sp. JCM 19000]